MRITVFTPTYNRAYIIGKLFDSLKRQSFRDFEWIVVDDGSTDDTEELFVQFQRETPFFPIRYFRTENGGKHRAINKGIVESRGEMFYIVDSDDYLPDDALEKIDRVEKTIPMQESNSFAGVCGQKFFSQERPIGNTFDGDFLDITSLERSAHGITGDKAEVFYTKLLRKYPFPEFSGEKFMTECVVWDKIAFDGYKLRFFNECTMICNYLPDGLTASGGELFRANPKGWGLFLYQSGLFGKNKGLNKWNSYLNYFYTMRGMISFTEIAYNLHTTPLVLWLRLTGMRIFYRLYR